MKEITWQQEQFEVGKGGGGGGGGSVVGVQEGGSVLNFML